MSDDDACQARPRAELEHEIMSPSVAKNDREWWAMEEIERLQTENWQLKQACGYSIPADKETINNPFKCGICDARNKEEAGAAASFIEPTHSERIPVQVCERSGGLRVLEAEISDGEEMTFVRLEAEIERLRAALTDNGRPAGEICRWNTPAYDTRMEASTEIERLRAALDAGAIELRKGIETMSRQAAEIEMLRNKVEMTTKLWKTMAEERAAEVTVGDVDDTCRVSVQGSYELGLAEVRARAETAERENEQLRAEIERLKRLGTTQ